MQLPIEITFRHMEHSDAVEQAVRGKAEKLDQVYSHIISCRVVVEPAHGHHHKGNLYHVGIDLTVPGKELAVSRDPEQNHAHEDVYVAIRDAFEAARRQLKAHARKERGEGKSHETPPEGWVAFLDPERDFGRIESVDGRDIYFHRNSVVDADFEALTVGTQVRFVEEQGDLGPQASTVKVEA